MRPDNRKAKRERGELLDLVDSSDAVVGTAPLGLCLEKGLLHRAVAVVVRRSGGDVVLQQRSLGDAWQPGKWTLSCTGHVKSRESYSRAARRELFEELRIRGGLRFLTKSLVPDVKEKGWVEREIVSLFVCSSDEPLTPDLRELERAESVPPSRVRLMLKGKDLTPDARFLLRKYLKLVRPESSPPQR